MTLSLNFSCNEHLSVCGLYLVCVCMWGHMCMSVKDRGKPHVLSTVFFEIEPLFALVLVAKVRLGWPVSSRAPDPPVSIC